MHKLMMIPADQLKRCPIQFRAVRKNTLEYMTLKESVRKKGILVSLLVRPVDDCYEVVDGNNRFEIVWDLRIPMVPCISFPMTDEEVLENQLITEASKIKASPVEYATRLWRLIHVDETKTIDELAHSLQQHPDWVRKTLNLVRLSNRAKLLMKKGGITSKIAVELAKLPPTIQDMLLDSLGTMSSKEFCNLTISEVRHQREGKKNVRHERSRDKQYEYRQMKEVIYELENPTVAASVILASGAVTPVEIWQTALSWNLKKDIASCEAETIRLEKIEASEANLIKRRITQHEKKEKNDDDCTDNC